MTRVLLLGPQRFRPAVGEAVRDLGGDGPVAFVTAGWQEREPDDAELQGLLGGRGVNLGLYARWTDVHDRDPDFAAADRRRRELLDELQAAYLLQLRHAMAAVAELRRQVGDPVVAAAAQEDALAAVRALDARHLERVGAVHAEFHADWPPHERPAVAAHRAEIARLLDGAAALAISGGHVGDLLACLHLFNVGAALRDQPVVAWSAGAMAVTETVVLFHDFVAHEPGGYAEVFDRGLGLARGVVALPHARRRLRLGDLGRMALLARRFDPARCLVLEDGASVDLADGACCPPGSTVLGSDGAVTRAA